jgi:ABC-2 type transport system ATP-binding protein
MLTNSLDAPVTQRPATHTPQSHVVPPAGESVIRVRGLRKRYGGREAVKGIDLDVRRGEIFAFLGPNGAGKTTTVEILEGFRQASDGFVEVLGKSPWRAPSAWRERIGAVLQQSESEPGLTVRECLQMYAGYYRAPRKVDETLALAELSEQADERATTLSGGQRRRLDVALALIGDPELVFLDEPTTGFDPSARRAAWGVIAGLRDLGKTVFLTTHYMEEAEYCDRIAIIDDGRIIALETPEALKASVGKDRIRITTDDDVEATRLLKELFDIDATTSEHELTFSVEQGEHFVPLLFSDLPVPIRSVSVARPTLDDVFMAYTGRTIRDAEDGSGDFGKQMMKARMGRGR